MRSSYFPEKSSKFSGLYGRTDFYGNVYNFPGFHRINLVEPGNESPFYVLSYKIESNEKYSFLLTSFLPGNDRPGKNPGNDVT